MPNPFVCPALVLICIVCATPLSADPPADLPAPAPALSPSIPPEPAATPAPAAATRTLVLHAAALIPLRFMETVSSDASQPGTNFRMEVTDDISIDDAVVIPAGSVVIGEVVHAQRAGAVGKAGELIVSARRLLVGEREIRLRSNLGNTGKSEMAAAFFVPFVHGKQAVIPADTEVIAKTAADENFVVPLSASH